MTQVDPQTHTSQIRKASGKGGDARRSVTIDPPGFDDRIRTTLLESSLSRCRFERRGGRTARAHRADWFASRRSGRLISRCPSMRRMLLRAHRMTMAALCLGVAERPLDEEIWGPRRVVVVLLAAALACCVSCGGCICRDGGTAPSAELPLQRVGLLRCAARAVNSERILHAVPPSPRPFSRATDCRVCSAHVPCSLLCSRSMRYVYSWTPSSAGGAPWLELPCRHANAA